MNKEFLQLLFICGSPLLFSLGGMFNKLIRRLLLPIFIGIILLLAHIPLTIALSCVISLSASLHLPYGEKTPYWLKFIVFCLYGLSALWIGFSWWMIISPVVMLALFKVSNTKWGQNIVFWRIWEGISGILTGITYASLI